MRHARGILTLLLLLALATVSRFTLPVEAAGSDASGWTSIGPVGIYVGQSQGLTSSPYASGAVDAIGWTPNYPDLIYVAGGPFSPGAGVDNGGLWKSTDGGESWSLIGGLPLVDAILVDPNDSSSVLVNTEGGIMKSTNSGQSWTTTKAGGSYGLGVLQYENGTVFATLGTAVLKSSDFGSSWQTIASSPGCCDLDAATFAKGGQTIFLGIWNGSALLFRSTDGGATFKKVLQVDSQLGSQVNDISINATNPENVWFAAKGYGCYESMDGGSNWARGSCDDQFVAVDPYDTGLLFSGGDGRFSRTAAGVSTTPLALGFTGLDVRNIVFGPNGTVFVGSDQGLYVSHDGGITWAGLNRRANSLISDGIAVSGDTIITIPQDYNVPVFSCNGGQNWSTGGGCVTNNGAAGDTNGWSVDTTYENDYLVTDPYNASMIILSHFVSHDGGVSFMPMSSCPGTVYYQSGQIAMNGCETNGIGVSSTGGISPDTVAFSPQGGVAYVVGGNRGSNPVYKTTDGGVSWNPLSGSPTGAIAVAVSYQNPSKVYALNLTGIYVSTDAGGTWTLQPGSACTLCNGGESLAVDPLNSSLVVMTNDYGVARSTQGGANMVQENVNATPGSQFNDGTALCSYLLPSGRAALIAVAGDSLYASFDFGLTWRAFDQGLPHDGLQGFTLTPQGDGYVTTWGYGVYEWKGIGAALEAAPAAGPVITTTTTLGPNPGPVPGFPYQPVGITALTVVVALSYLSIRRRRGQRPAHGV